MRTPGTSSSAGPKTHGLPGEGWGTYGIRKALCAIELEKDV